MIAGFCGVFALTVALAFTGIAVGSLISSVSQRSSEEIGTFVGGCFFALIAWVFTVRWLKYAIIGDQKSRKSELFFKGRSEHINYE